MYDERHFSGSSPSRSPLACISIITLAGIIRVTGEIRKATDEGMGEIMANET